MTKIMRIGSSIPVEEGNRAGTALLSLALNFVAWHIQHNNSNVREINKKRLRGEKGVHTLNKSRGIISADVATVVIIVVAFGGGGVVLWFESPSMWTRYWDRWFTLFFSFFCGYIFTRYCHRHCGLWWSGDEPLGYINNFYNVFIFLWTRLLRLEMFERQCYKFGNFAIIELMYW